MSKIQKNLRNFVLGASILGVAAGLGATTPAGSAPSFDGVWSVVIITDKGACDRAYRYPIRIRNGALGAEGSSPATINGKVASNGQVTVTVQTPDGTSSAGTFTYITPGQLATPPISLGAHWR